MSKSPGLLLVDDDAVFAATLARALGRHGYEVRTASDLNTAHARITEDWPDFAIVDMRLGEASGLQLIDTIARLRPTARSIVLTGFGSIATAVDAVKRGASQYLTKPATVADIVAALEDRNPAAQPPRRRLSVRRLEWEYIQKALAENGGNVSATARALGMHRRTLQRKLQKRPVRE